VTASEGEGWLSLGRVALVPAAATADPAGAQVVAALHGRPSGGASWFALLDRERGGEETELADAVAEFVSRYGLRFQRV
jgi:hypothetical protein